MIFGCLIEKCVNAAISSCENHLDDEHSRDSDDRRIYFILSKFTPYLYFKMVKYTRADLDIKINVWREF